MDKTDNTIIVQMRQIPGSREGSSGCIGLALRVLCPPEQAALLLAPQQASESPLVQGYLPERIWDSGRAHVQPGDLHDSPRNAPNLVEPWQEHHHNQPPPDCAVAVATTSGAPECSRVLVFIP